MNSSCRRADKVLKGFLIKTSQTQKGINKFRKPFDTQKDDTCMNQSGGEKIVARGIHFFHYLSRPTNKTFEQIDKTNKHEIFDII